MASVGIIALEGDRTEEKTKLEKLGSSRKRGWEEVENGSLGASSFTRRGPCCRTCEGFGGVGLPDARVLAQLKVNCDYPPLKKSKIQQEGESKSRAIPRPGHEKRKSCCPTCEGLGGMGLPPAEYLAQVERTIKVNKTTPPIWVEWLEERSKARESTEEEVSDEVIQNPAWWYAQVCLPCLKVVQHCSLLGHLRGITHRKCVMKNGLCANYTRKIPLLVCPANLESNMRYERDWGREQVTRLEVLPQEKLLDSVAELHRGLRCLVLGEQDFSFSNTLATIVDGEHIIGTCYLSEHDPSIPDVKTLDDGQRRFHQQKSLGSMAGDLRANLALAERNGVRIRFNVDAQDIPGSLLDKEATTIEPFDRIIFPFPRVSLVRGCDPNNSVLIKRFLTSAMQSRCLAQNGLVQLIMLENQFREWDILHIAEEVGFRLRAVGWMNFNTLPYQARDVTGKRINSNAMSGKTLYISFARDPVLAKI